MNEDAARTEAVCPVLRKKINLLCPVCDPPAQASLTTTPLQHWQVQSGLLRVQAPSLTVLLPAHRLLDALTRGSRGLSGLPPGSLLAPSTPSQ